MTVDDMLADGDFVITRWTGRLLQQLGATVQAPAS
jgi:hypothetical protein